MKIHSFLNSVLIDSLLEFRSLQNVSGASQQNSVVAFS